MGRLGVPHLAKALQPFLLGWRLGRCYLVISDYPRKTPTIYFIFPGGGPFFFFFQGGGTQFCFPFLAFFSRGFRPILGLLPNPKFWTSHPTAFFHIFKWEFFQLFCFSVFSRSDFNLPFFAFFFPPPYSPCLVTFLTEAMNSKPQLCAYHWEIGFL